MLATSVAAVIITAGVVSAVFGGLLGASVAAEAMAATFVSATLLAVASAAVRG